MLKEVEGRTLKSILASAITEPENSQTAERRAGRVPTSRGPAYSPSSRKLQSPSAPRLREIVMSRDPPGSFT